MKTQYSLHLMGAALLLLATSELKAFGAVLPVSATDRTNIAAAGGSFTPVFSADGRFIVFVSHANNLVTNDDLSPYLDVFTRNLATSNTVLVSVNITGIGGGNADANYPSVSSNGQFIAFASAAGNLVNNDTNNAPDIFVRDVVSGVTTLVSVDVTGTNSAGILSPGTRYRLASNPLISPDGRWVIFESLATNLVALDDTNQMTDIFARDLQSSQTYLVSVNAAGTSSGTGNSESPALTPDGRFVAFVSTSDNLVPGATNRSGDIYVRDLQSETTTWASRNVAGFFTNTYRCLNPVLSSNGRFVAFKAVSLSDMASVFLIRHDLQTEVTTVLTSNSAIGSWPEMSADGRFIASEDFNDVYVWDLQTGSNVLVSVDAAGSGPANQPSHTPVMTPDGRNVAFLSTATDLALNATNGLSQVYVRDLATQTTRLVSENVDGSASGSDIDVRAPAISADGRQVAFESLAADLTANDLNQASDVFLRDLDSGTMRLVSARDGALAARTTPTLSTLFPKAISADGRYVAINSLDGYLVAADTNETQDVFVRDLVNGTITRLSLPSNAPPAPNLEATLPAISANGRYIALSVQTPSVFIDSHSRVVRYDLQSGTTATASVRFDGTGPVSGSSSAAAISSDGNLIAFQSLANDVVGGVSFSHSNIFVRDMTLGSNKLVSVHRFSYDSADSFGAAFSPDDRWIVFASRDRDLTTNRTDGVFPNLFARDLFSSTTVMISVGPDGSTLASSGSAVFSADSRYVAFATASNSVAVYDLQNRTSTLVCTGCGSPSISADGRLVAYATSPGDVIVKNLQTGATNLISINRFGTGGGNGSSTSPLLSWDGRFVVFASKASDLVDNDTNNTSDIFVRDRLLGTTLLVSLNFNSDGAGNGPSSKPVLAADGRTILFQSFAGDLVPGDYNDRRDVFVLRLGGRDSDGDGMDDDWEMAYFGTLSRDGSGDFDADGQSDLDEFLAGTDPTDSGSILQVLRLSAPGSGSTRLIWSAAPGKKYRVQAKDGLEASGWNHLSDEVIASGTTASFVDNSAGAASRRFYRVLTAP